jgi:hypothetical protein
MTKNNRFSPAKIKVRPKGLHNFAFYILIFDFPSPFSLFLFLFSLAPNVIVRKDLRTNNVLYICRDTFTDVMSALQIHLFMQNKANFRKSQMNVTDLLTMSYDKLSTRWSGKNKANTKPIQTQFKANTKPIQTQFQGSTMLNCVICSAVFQPANPFSSRCTSSIGSPITFVRLPSILSTNSSASFMA